MSSKQECPVPKGILLVIGGKEDKGTENQVERKKPDGTMPMEILDRFVQLIGKEGATLAVITSGSSEGEESFEEYRKLFEEKGVSTIHHVHHLQHAEVLADDGGLMQQCNAFFFAGGNQLLLTSLYGGTPFLTLLKKRYIYERIVVGGTSAGAMALSTPMIYAGNEEVQQIGGEIKVTTGLEFMKDVCIDTHFVHRGRFVRLAQVISTNPACVGAGIEEDTAIIVTNGLEAEVIGSGTVIILDGSRISSSSMLEFTDKKPVSIRNLQVDILAHGDKYVFPQTNPPHI